MATREITDAPVTAQNVGAVSGTPEKATPVYSYEPNSWGPNEIERVTPPGGWQNPIVAHETSAVAGQAA